MSHPSPSPPDERPAEDPPKDRQVHPDREAANEDTNSGIGSDSVMRQLRLWELRRAADRAKQSRDKPM